jgi:hypothetical protein
MQILDCRLQTADCTLQTADCALQTADCIMHSPLYSYYILNIQYDIMTTCRFCKQDQRNQRFEYKHRFFCEPDQRNLRNHSFHMTTNINIHILYMKYLILY